jgi:hypothetical protein
MKKLKYISSSTDLSPSSRSNECLSLEELELALAAKFKHAHDSNASIDGTHLWEKGLHISAHLGMADFLASSGCISRFKGRHNIAY